MNNIHKHTGLSVIALVSAMIFSSQVSANWKLISSTASVNVYLNQATIYKRGPYTLVWLLNHFSQPQRTDEGLEYQSSQSLLSINCREGTFGIKVLKQYELGMAEGKIISNIEHEDVYRIKYFDISPDTISGEVYNQICM